MNRNIRFPTAIENLRLLANKMGRAVNDLPNEILIEILLHLDLKDLKRARLTSTRWAKAGARGLFTRIYFSPHREVMDLFENITSNPAFAAGVTTLVYDARLFWEYYTVEMSYFIAYSAEVKPLMEDEDFVTSMGDFDSQPEELSLDLVSPEYRTGFAASFARYKDFYTEQSEILNTGTDFDLLCQGLKRLPDLLAVTIDDKCGDGDFNELHGSSNFPVRDIWRGMVQPNSWHVGEELNEQAMADLDEEGDRSIDYPTADSQWDWRNITNCLRAVSLHCPQLQHLHFGAQTSKIPILLLIFPPVFTSLENVASGLRCLKFDAQLSTNNEELFEEHAQAVTEFGKMLSLTQNLSSLSSSIRLDPPVWRKTFGNVVWPSLKNLELGDMELTCEILKLMCHRHNNTLQHLKLRNLKLQQPDSVDTETFETWNGVGKELGDVVNLRSVNLSSLFALEFGGYLEDDKLRQVARRILRWVPPHLLEWDHHAGGAIVLKHK